MRKLRIKREQDRIILIDSFVGWVSLIVAGLLSIIGLGMLSLLIYEVLHTGWIEDVWLNLWGVGFSLVWSVFALIAMFNCCRSTYRIVINAHGIYEKPMLPVRKPRFYPWNQLIDWGISYFVSDRYGTQYYELYFSDRALSADKRNEKRKKANKAITLSFEEYDYDRVKIEVLPYVLQYTDMIPFDGTNVQ